MLRRNRSRMLIVEPLESRCVLSFIFGVDLDHADHADHDCDEHGLAADESSQAKGGGGGGPGGGGSGPAIRLDVVALHEFGHALGLGHSSDSSSVMYAYYNAGYNLENFASDSAVATMQAIYANVATSPWKDSLDPSPGNGRVDVTYSFVPDGSRMDQGTSTTFATFNAIFGAGNWQSIFAGELNRWAANSNGKLAFVPHSDSGSRFNYAGAAQNDAASGDIRIGAHRFDGGGKVLAHTYFPPPNGMTAAGDAHFDQAERWVLGSGAVTTVSGGGGGGNSSRGNLVLGDWDGPATAALLVTLESDDAASPSITTTVATAEADAGSQVNDARSIGAVALVTSSVPTQAASDWDDFAIVSESDEQELISADAEDPAWLDALAWQRIAFERAVR